MNLNKIEKRVRYADTDHFGVVYYGRYLEWLEEGRTEILRDNGVSYADFEKKGLFAPVIKVEIEYKNAPQYDDIIVVETKIERIGNSSIDFSYKVYRKSDELPIATGKTTNVFITRERKPTKVPDEVRKILD
jgi:acyl-CoA thioester hydrolase